MSILDEDLDDFYTKTNQGGPLPLKLERHMNSTLDSVCLRKSKLQIVKVGDPNYMGFLDFKLELWIQFSLQFGIGVNFN